MPAAATIDLDTLGRVGQALADPTRRAILARLTSGPVYPGELAAEFDVGKSGISNHLPVSEGAVSCRPRVKGGGSATSSPIPPLPPR
jgi:DNA-binding transcriptional ArsR family regulator